MRKPCIVPLQCTNPQASGLNPKLGSTHSSTYQKVLQSRPITSQSKIVTHWDVIKYAVLRGSVWFVAVFGKPFCLLEEEVNV